jgi:hypothetical protein
MRRPVPMTHDIATTVREASSGELRGKSWWYTHVCPTCHRSGRFNKNYLGTRGSVVCDGVRFIRQVEPS